MFWEILYYVSMTLVFIAGGVIFYAVHDEKDFLVKDAIGLVAITIVLGIIPIANTFVLLILLVGVIGAALEDDSSDIWWNKPAFGDKQDKQ